MEQHWLAQHGLDTRGLVQSDGLGGDAYIEPRVMVRYLAFLRTQPFFAQIRRGLPVLGRDGTLFDIQTHSPAVGHVYAKTGTWSTADILNGRSLVTAKGLAGYMTTQAGRHLAFCLYVNNVVSPPRTDGAHLAGEALGAIASAIYEDTH
jgi:D-alanyl-D-alanine carboxypeptidase/D-alanyl-D-alanine-endopeptidase (penicillin-binding protein 4)